jgi:hypothetical protein
MTYTICLVYKKDITLLYIDIRYISYVNLIGYISYVNLIGYISYIHCPKKFLVGIDHIVIDQLIGYTNSKETELYRVWIL